MVAMDDAKRRAEALGDEWGAVDGEELPIWWLWWAPSVDRKIRGSFPRDPRIFPGDPRIFSP